MIPSCATCGAPASWLYNGVNLCFDDKFKVTKVGTMVPLPPYVGMPATICYVSDRYAATVVYVSKTGSKVVVREDTATRTDNNGMSESQTYEYTPDPNGTEHTFFRNSRGGYGARSKKLVLGVKESYYDYSY